MPRDLTGTGAGCRLVEFEPGRVRLSQIHDVGQGSGGFKTVRVILALAIDSLYEVFLTTSIRYKGFSKSVGHQVPPPLPHLQQTFNRVTLLQVAEPRT